MSLPSIPSPIALFGDVLKAGVSGVAPAAAWSTMSSTSSPNNAIGDGVDGNDAPYLPVFPYLAVPRAGNR